MTQKTTWLSLTRIWPRLWTFGITMGLGVVLFHFGPWTLIVGPHWTSRAKAEWSPCFRCYACDRELTNFERMHSAGVCPGCGHTGLGTICHTKRFAKRWDGEKWEYKE